MKDLSLFDVNASIGRGAYEPPEFDTAENLLAHMDRLGIERTLVWHREARDTNPTWGNRRLLEDLDACSAADDRLIPALTVTPACFYEEGALDFLKEQLAAGRTRALRIFPAVSRFPVRQLERLLAEIEAFRPAVFMDCRFFSDEMAFRDLEYLAETLPRVTYVVTQKMWMGFGSVIDLMWRCSNVFVDTSWIHMRDNVELLVRRFGPDRVLFGTGYASHHGAAIAALAHAALTPKQRAMIAHANLERILGLGPAKQTVEGEVAGKPLWEAFRQGQRVNAEIIDAHGHIGPATRGWYLRQNRYETQLPAMVKRMDDLGIQSLYVSGENALFGDCVAGNRLAEEKTKPYRGRIVGYLVFNPLYGKEMTAELDAFFSGDYFVGFKVLPAYWKIPVTDPGYEPVWDYANRHALPILLHTWDDSYNSPALLKEIAPAYPDATFLLGHSGGGTRGRQEAVELALANDNVILEFCGSFTTPVDWVDTFDAIGFDRVVFGSDTDAHDQAWELGRLLSLPVPDDKLGPVLAGTMKRILARRR